jgi:glyceraldehyde-3-phosphate dehydrogenase (NADP+)
MNQDDRIARIFPQEQDIPESCRLGEPVEQRQYLIDGVLHQWSGPMEEVHSPVYVNNGSGWGRKLLGRFPLLGEHEAMEALEAAQRAYGQGGGEWPEMSVTDRIRHMEEFVFRMTEKKREVVNLLMWEVGKSYQDSQKEFDRTVVYIKDTINALKDLDRESSRFVIEQGIIGQIRRAPLGVALCLGPFNYPLNETYTSVIPALIMGCTVIFKPPKKGALLHGPMLEAFRDSFPPGVINVLFGHGAQVASPLMATGGIDVFAFVGTSEVANALKKQHPKLNRLRSSLGLEAKNPAIILPDADLDLTVSECVLGTLSFNGQRCTALKLLYVHNDIIGQFLEKFSHSVDNLKCGLPWEPGVFITPLPEPGRPAYLSELVADAASKGARIVNDRGGVTAESFFYPSILYPVTPQMRVYHEEQFGPVIPIVPFTSLDTVLEGIYNSPYGQQASIFSRDAGTIAHLVDRLITQVGRVNINSQCQRGPDTYPFTGRKDSAEGTLSVHDALRVFSLRTLVAAKEMTLNQDLITEIVREHKSSFLSTDFIL